MAEWKDTVVASVSGNAVRRYNDYVREYNASSQKLSELSHKASQKVNFSSQAQKISEYIVKSDWLERFLNKKL